LRLAELIRQAVLVLFLSHATSTHANCDFIDRSSPEVTAKLQNDFIAEGELRLPHAYVKSFAFVDGATRDALMLSVWRETLQPFTRADETSDEQRARFRGGHRDQLIIVVGGGNSQELVARYAVKSEYGIPIDSSGGDLQGIPLPNGLYGQRMDAPMGFSNVYLAREGHRISDIIRCKQAADVPYPNCSHRMEVGSFHVQTTYPLSELDHWKTYKNRVSSLVSCFIIHMPTKVKGD